MEEPLVSIIIPTYNRAHLIRETLDSVLAQTYQNWECIVVDDGSTDETEAVMAEYCKDLRIRFIKRPINRGKGGNTCRNIGLESAKGEYIIFFDSDDLMTTHHIAEKLTPLLRNGYDFSIAKTKYLNSDKDNLESYYKFDEFEITAHNYIVQNINWLTYDTCIKSSLAKSVKFNEKLKSGQEYNYHSQLVLRSCNAVFINKYLTLRRIHDGSIRHGLKDRKKKEIGTFLSVWTTYQTIKDEISLETKKKLLYWCTTIIYSQSAFVGGTTRQFLIEYFKVFDFNTTNFITMYFLKKYFGRGYFFLARLKKISN